MAGTHDLPTAITVADPKDPALAATEVTLGGPRVPTTPPEPGKAPHEPPSDLAGFCLKRKLGAGGMGAVYHAEKEDGTPLAVKVLRPDLAGADVEFIARFRRESRLLAEVRSPHLVSCLGSGEDRGWCWLAMEYLPDGDLSSYLHRRGQLMERDVLGMAIQCCHGLEALHAHGIVHRDFKPANVFLDLGRGQGREPVAKVGDLGLARHSDGEDRFTLTGTACGTPAYMAPEQIRGERELDARVDVYAMGATLFKLIAGHDPFTGASVFMVTDAALKLPAPDPRKHNPLCSAALAGLIQRAMAKPRGERHESLALLRSDLERLRAGRSLLASAAAPVVPGPTPASMIFKEVAGEAAPKRSIPRLPDGGGSILDGLGGLGPVLRMGLPALIGVGLLWLAAGQLSRRDESPRPATAATAAVVAMTAGTDTAGAWRRLDLAGQEFVWRLVPAGAFTRGHVSGAAYEQPASCTLSQPVLMLDREVTGGMWAVVMGDPVQAGQEVLPMAVSGHQAQLFCLALGKRLGRTVRLPSEAEFERAALLPGAVAPRGLTDPALLALWPRTSEAQIPTAIEDAQRWRTDLAGPLPAQDGLLLFHDLLGNQAEWCQDQWDGAGPLVADETDPVGAIGTLMVIKGGSWLHPVARCTSWARFAEDPGITRAWTGFRVVTTP